MSQAKDVLLAYRLRRAAGYTLVAAAYEQTEAAKYLIEQGADINAVNEDGETPLSAAMETGNRDLIQTLLENGARR